jgi:glycosyltransferase involved in cell wall biosynthesis
MSPTVSVVIAAYQAAEFVGEAIGSALAQTMPDLEVLVVDDCSTDATWTVLTQWAARDPRVRPLRQARRSGPGAARNAGISAARGTWIAILDADDLFLPERLERLTGTAEARGADLMADNLLMADFASGRSLGLRFRESSLACTEAVTLQDAIRRDMPCVAEGEKFGFLQPIIRRDFLERHRIRYAEEVRAGEDWLLYGTCIAHGARFHTGPEGYYVYRLRGGSVTANRANTLSQSAGNRHMRRICARLGHHDVLPLLLERQRMIDIDSYALLVERGQLLDALRHAHPGSPARLLRHARIAFGALRRKLNPPRPELATAPQ